MKKRLALIDADSMIYIIAWKFRNKNVANLVKMSLSSFINDTLEQVGATHYIGFYGSKEEGAEPNFRYQIDTEYKKTRPPAQDFIAKWRPVIHEHMKTKWGFMPVSGMEADDAIAIANAKYKDEYDSIVVITADKDLKQIADTTHFDMNKKIATEINKIDADKFFAEQMLKGDPGDCIKGLPGIGPKKAVNLLADCENSTQLKWTVIRMYCQHFTDQEAKIAKKSAKALESKWMDDNSENLEKEGYTPKQIARKARLHVDKELEDEIRAEQPYTWKEYIVQQYRLLRMIEDSPEGFVMPDVQETSVEVKEAGDDEGKAEGITDIMTI